MTIGLDEQIEYNYRILNINEEIFYTFNNQVYNEIMERFSPYLEISSYIRKPMSYESYYMYRKDILNIGPSQMLLQKWILIDEDYLLKDLSKIVSNYL